MVGCIVVENIEELTEAMRHLAQDPELRYNNGRKLHRYAEQHCRMEDKIKQFNDVIENGVVKLF